MAADLVSRAVDDAAGPKRVVPGVPRDETRRIAVRDEADVHALRLVGDREIQPRRLRPHLGLGQLADREERAPELRLPEHEEEVGLILRRIDGRVETEAAGGRIRPAPGVVAGREPPRAQLAGALPEEVELHVLVTARARVRGAAAEILADERLDHVARERIRQIEHVVREAEAIGDRTGVVEVVERAAAPAPVTREPERDPDHLVTGRHAAGGGDGAVDPAAHRDDDPLPTHAAASPRTCATSRGSISSTWSMSAAVVV